MPSSATPPTQSEDVSVSLTDYLKQVLTARVYDVAVESDLTPAHTLSRRLHNKVLLKREDQQAVFSFKLRGAYNKMAHLETEELKHGVVCASAGNHAQGVALAASRLGTHAVIVMPVTTPQVKIDAVKNLGGEIELAGDSYSDAYQRALQIQAERKLTFIHPFDDPLVIAGQGTIAMEILRQHQGAIDAIFVPIGGGGLISGIAGYVKAVRPEIKVIGVHMTDSDAMAQSVAAHERLALADVGLFADGTAVKQVGVHTLAMARAYVDDYVRVDTDAVCAAIKDIFIDTRSVVEPSGALAVAAIKQYAAQNKAKGATYVAILSGANMNFERLRFVAERAEVGEEHEALLAVTIPEERGSFRRLCEVIAALPHGPRNVTEFNYRMSATSEHGDAHVFVGVSTPTRGESPQLLRAFERAGFRALDLTHDDLAKEHLRYMVGGRSPFATNERLLRFIFPEKPGALTKFLRLMRPNWNISLFHYRHHGADYGQTLVGIQVPPADDAAFRAYLKELDYPWVDETSNPAYRLFLRRPE